MSHKDEDQEDDGVVELDKELIFVVKLHETLVNNFDIAPTSMILQKDPDIGFLEGEFIFEYDLGYGETLTVSCKREGGNMLIKLDSNGREMQYSAPIDHFIDDDFMPVADEEFCRLVNEWFE